jgi:hypothetical protein
MHRAIALALIIVLVASSMLLLQTACAQSITQPSAPELTVKQIDQSYDVPLTYRTSTNPYTGQQETTSEGGYHVENKTIQLTIKNPVYDDRDWLHYNVRIKGHFTSDWTNLYGANDTYCPEMTNSDYTVIAFSNSYGGGFSGPNGARISAPSGGQVDIQVAVIEQSTVTHGDPHMQFSWGYNNVYTQLGDWSNIQTITIGTITEVQTSTPAPTNPPSEPTPPPIASSAPTQNPTATPIQPNTQTDVLSGSTWQDIALAVACGVIAVLAAALVLSLRRRAR